METITIDFLPAGATAVCHASQFDPERVIRMNLRNGGAVYTLSGSEIIKAKITRPDGTNIVENIENTASSYVDLVTSAGTCDVSGTNKGELVIEKDGATIGSKNFRMEVEEDPYGGAGGVVVESASGAIASFETDIEDELVELKAKIEPVQDLHGYTHPWAGGAGKNIACLSADKIANSQRCNITYTDNNNIVVTATDAFGRAMFVVPCKPDTVYTVSFKGTSTGNYKRIFISPDANWSGQTAYGTLYLSATEELERSLTFTTVSDATYIYVGFYPTATETSGEMTIKNFMIEEGSSATEFEPYENICPISGHDEVNITRTGKNQLKNIIAQISANVVTLGQDNDNTYGTYLKKGQYTIKYKTTGTTASIYMRSNVDEVSTRLATTTQATFNAEYDGLYRFWLYRGAGVNASDISEAQIELGSSATEYLPYAGETKKVEFDDTVYSAELDAKNGELAKDGYIESYNGETIEEPWISSKDAFVPGTTPTAGAQVVYKKSNPDKVATATANFSTLTDQTNNVYNDTGDTSLKYYKREGRATA